MSRIDLNELRKTRTQAVHTQSSAEAREKRQRANAAEQERVEAVEEALENLKDTLMTAAQAGDAQCKILKLDHGMVEGAKHKLLSAAYRDLKAELEREGLAVHVVADPQNDEGQGRSWTDYYLAVDLP